MKTRLLIFFLTAILLIVLGQYFFLPGWYRESGINISGWLIFLSVAIAIVLSIWLINWVIFKLSTSVSRSSRVGLYIGGYGIYPIALFLGFVIGGNFGGAMGDHILGAAGVVVGVGVGVFFVTTVICFVGIMLGLLLGGLTQRLIK